MEDENDNIKNFIKEETTSDNEEITIKEELLDETTREPLSSLLLLEVFKTEPESASLGSKKNVNELVKQELKSNEKKSLNCKVCGKNFSIKTGLHYHLRTHTGEKPFECKVCEKKFITGTQLRRHLRIHTGEKPIQCEICKKRFSDRSNYTRHLRFHRGEKPYQCKVCNKGFSVNSVLQLHILTHTGKRASEMHKFHTNDKVPEFFIPETASLDNNKISHKCELCGNFFSKLTSHLRTHTGEKPFECKVCERKFVRSHQLKRHLRIHTGEKPVECEICMKRFSDKSNYTRHLRFHTGEKPYECQVCKKEFTTSSGLRQHAIIHNSTNRMNETFKKKNTSQTLG